MFRSALVGLALMLVWSPTAAMASTTPAPVPVVNAHDQDSSGDDDGGDCKNIVIVCAGKQAIDLGTGVVGGIVGDGTDAVVGGAMNGAGEWVAKGAAWLIEQIAEEVDRSTKPAMQSDWFKRSYASMAQLAIVFAPLFLLLAAGQAVMQQQFVILLRALAALPLAMILTFAAVTIVQLGLAITDWMTASVLTGAGNAPTDAFRSIAKLFVSPNTDVAGFVLFLTGVLMAVFSLAVWIELALREAAIYVAVAFMPLTFIAMVWRPTTIWCRRLTEGLVAVILSKFVLAVAFTLAAGALGGAGEANGGGLSVIVAGGAVLLIAAIAPFVLMRMIPLAQAATEQGVSRQQVGGAARSAPGITTATGATRMLMYGKFGGGSPPPPSPAAPDGSPVPAAARRGAGPADVPVAVIPDPGKQPRTGGRDGSR